VDRSFVFFYLIARIGIFSLKAYECSYRVDGSVKLLSKFAELLSFPCKHDFSHLPVHRITEVRLELSPVCF
jgi:hypothetical protein